ncbi:MAG: MurR/RpiR family transcriptional regulator [Pseudomonadota bacterium]
MSVIESISNSTESLTPNEKRLVKAVMDSPTDAALGTASDLARTTGVHEATASRLARKLGYTSYAAFRDALRDEFIATRETATRFEKTIAETSSETILGSLVQEEIQALSRMETYISADQINTVAEQLMGARRIFVYGHGNAEVLALLMLKRFRRFGKDVHKLNADSRSLAEQALSLTEGDVVLTFVFRRAPKGYAPLIETAREAGATNIVISGITGTTLSPRPNYSLAAPRSGHPDAFQTLTVPMAICNAVVIAAGLTAKEESLQKLEKLGQLIERFE